MTNPPDTVVQAILDAMPYTTDGHVTDFAGNLYDAAPLAAKYAATTMRWLAGRCAWNTGFCGYWYGTDLRELADQLDRPEEPTP